MKRIGAASRLARSLTLAALLLGESGCDESTTQTAALLPEWERSLESGLMLDTVESWGDGGVLASVWTDAGPYAARFNAAGEEVWRAEVKNGSVSVVAADGAGHGYVGGLVFDASAWRGTKLEAASYPASFLVKVNADGDAVWTKTYNEGRNNGVSELVATSTSVVFAGQYTTGFSIDGESLVPGQAGASPAYLVRLDAEGATELVRSYGSAATIGALVPDADGGVFVAGSFSGVIGFGGSAGKPLASSGSALFFAKLDPNGDASWAKHFVGSGNLDATRWDTGYALTVRGDLFDLGLGRWLGGQAVARVEADGSIAWAKQLGRYLGNLGSSPVAVLATGELVTGRTEDPTGDGATVYYPGAPTSAGVPRELVALTKRGTLLASYPLDTLAANSYPVSFNVTATPDGGVVTGSSTETYGRESYVRESVLRRFMLAPLEE